MPTIAKGSRKKAQRARASSSKIRQPKRLRISVIGAGRLGTTLGRALSKTGHSIELVVTKHSANARRAAKLIDKGAKPLNSIQLEHLAPPERDRLFGSNLVLISTPDDVLEAVAARLATVFRTKRSTGQRIALHTSGALSSQILKPLQTAGFAVGSLHPLISIADGNSRKNQFAGAYFCVEGNPAAVRVARSLVRELEGHSFTIDARSKALYHAAAVMSSGHVTALFDLAIEMLKHCGLTPRRAQQLLQPLLASATTNLSAKTPAQALTGTFARGDVVTARRHLAAMKSDHLKEAAAAYVLLGTRSIKLSRIVKSDSHQFEQLANLLARFRQT
jgi:predicted short-subunit dehydrogenase-like oxidoreductase (DUF2520 family)